MKHLPRVLMFAAVLSLLTLFVFPMWYITLIAPQYPDGVTMHIWINKIGGNEPGVLQNINILNHYVGMKYIEPDAIPELQYFPYIVMGMAFLGLICVFFNKRWMFLSWMVVLTILAALGIYDFYLWEYDYGHNLSPTAPIKIPGASFQPPLIGSKLILNFIAKSFPHIGGYFAGLAIILSGLAWWIKSKIDFKQAIKIPGFMKNNMDDSTNGKSVLSEKTSTAAFKAVSMMIFLFLIASCQPSPKPIEYGADDCYFCKMSIVDAQHAAEAVTDKGKIYTFDAIECLVNFVETNPEKEFSFLLVNDFDTPKKLIDASSSYFLISENVPSPMGAYLSAFESESSVQKLKAEKGGDIFNWEELKVHLKEVGIVSDYMSNAD